MTHETKLEAASDRLVVFQPEHDAFAYVRIRYGRSDAAAKRCEAVRDPERAAHSSGGSARGIEIAYGEVMKNRALLVRGCCLLALAGIALSSAACEERVVVRHPAPAVVVRTPPPVVEERVIVR